MPLELNHTSETGWGVKIDAEHAGAIIFKPKSSKTYEFSQFLNKTTFFWHLSILFDFKR